MRWALLVVVASVIGLSLPAEANHFTLRLSKANGSWSAYLDDNAACRSATRIRTYIQTRTSARVYGDTYRSGNASEAERLASEQSYWDCMAARGYRADPNGYRAASIYYEKNAPRYAQQSE